MVFFLPEEKGKKGLKLVQLLKSMKFCYKAAHLLAPVAAKAEYGYYVSDSFQLIHVIHGLIHAQKRVRIRFESIRSYFDSNRDLYCTNKVLVAFGEGIHLYRLFRRLYKGLKAGPVVKVKELMQTKFWLGLCCGACLILGAWNGNGVFSLCLMGNLTLPCIAVTPVTCRIPSKFVTVAVMQLVEAVMCLKMEDGRVYTISGQIQDLSVSSPALEHSKACVGIMQSVSSLLSMEVDLLDTEPGTINEGSIVKKSKQRKRKNFTVDEEGQMGSREKLAKRILLSLTRPSYVMGLGPKPLRKEHRTRLHYLLRRLVNQHHWVAASGVLSAYMKGTLNDTSPFRNRLKFWVLMELLKHMKNNSINPTRIKNLYDIWWKKIGSMKTWPLQVVTVSDLQLVLKCLKLPIKYSTNNTFLFLLCLGGIRTNLKGSGDTLPQVFVLLGHILLINQIGFVSLINDNNRIAPSAISNKMTIRLGIASKLSEVLSSGDAYQLALCIEQERVDIHPVLKMMMGLTFYELWYSSIPKEFQWRNSDQFDLQENSNMEETSFTNKTGQSEQYNSVESHMADSHCQRDSDASIMNNKHISRDVIFNEDMEVDTNKRENPHQNFQPEGFYLNSEEQKGYRDPFSNSGGLTQDILYGLGKMGRFRNIYLYRPPLDESFYETEAYSFCGYDVAERFPREIQEAQCRVPVFIKLVFELIAHRFLVLIAITLWFTINFNIVFLCIYVGGLDLWLLPLNFSDERNFEEFMYVQRNQPNAYYENSVKYLQLSLNSEPSASAALLPLVQEKDVLECFPFKGYPYDCTTVQFLACMLMYRASLYCQLLLIGGQVDEALNMLEKQCCNTASVLPLRVRAALLERFDRNNSVVLLSCLENILKKDPTCSDALAKLIKMHQNGEYRLDSLLEMIALHLDVTDSEHNTWKVFSSCFLRLFSYEEDCMSSCPIQTEYGHKQHRSFYKTPKIFWDGTSGKSWYLRCRWWITRHFSNSKLESEIKSGDLQLLTCKAACASYMYGREFSYVEKVFSHLEKENDKELLLFLDEHRGNSLGIYKKIRKKLHT
ncbi:hypothetical protein VNO80_26878 [Phaseolus coccineus]|uniref:Uncharacterized protein n=1 Tax=Phaseolus coccineus TaxID=3886 RepID=A0AAN9LIV3_PHACN